MARIRAVLIALLFLMSGVGASMLINPINASPNSTAPSVAAPVAAAPSLSQAEANWASPDGNQFNQNYNPQNQINASTAQYLGLSWLFPVPSRATDKALAGFAGFARASEGVDSAPLIINGTVYVITQFGEIFALDAATGATLWSTQLPVRTNATLGIQGVANIALHLHDGSEQFTTKLFSGTPTLWYAAPDLKIYAVSALTGKIELNWTYFGGANTIPGNSPTALYLPIAPNVLVDQNRGIVITSIGSPSSPATGRCFYDGWNILVSPPKLMWTTFCTPPQPQGNLPPDPSWDIQQVNNMTGAEIFYPGPSADGGGYIPNDHGQAVVNLKTLSTSQLNATLYNDWGYVNQSQACLSWDGGVSTGSTAAGWGAPWLLGIGPTAGMAFVNTNNRDPFSGMCVTGTNLWSASVLAVNETNGNWIWGFQTFPHEMMDYDCSWYQGLGNETVSGQNTQVLWKTCKDGYLYELNALTGNLIWAWTGPQSIEPRCANCYPLDPRNATQMAYPYFNPNGLASGVGTIMNPSTGAGFEDEQAYNPQLNYLFAVEQNSPVIAFYVPDNGTNYLTNTAGFATVPVHNANPQNSTVFAINAATGQTVWTYTIPLQGYRGGVTTSGGLVFASVLSGDLLILNAQTGALVRDYYIGGPLNQLATIGATIHGKEQIVMSINAGGTSAPTPGDIFALGLNIPTGALTASTTITTTTTTSVSTLVSTSISTTTATGSAVTQTVTSTLQGSGASTALYGIAAVAVIFIIATGYLAMRGRKPAS